MTEISAETAAAREGSVGRPNAYLEFFSRLFREQPL